MPLRRQLGTKDILTDLRRINTGAGLGSGSVKPHNLLGPKHSDTSTNAPSEGAMILGDSTSAWATLLHPDVAGYALVTDATTWTIVAANANLPVAPGDRGHILRGEAGPVWASYNADTLGAVLIGDGTDIISDTTPTFVGNVTLDGAALELRMYGATVNSGKIHFRVQDVGSDSYIWNPGGTDGLQFDVENSSGAFVIETDGDSRFAGNASVAGFFAVGAAIDTTVHAVIQDLTLDITTTYDGLYVAHKKDAGATDAADDLRNIYAYLEYDQTGANIGELIGTFNHVVLTDGTATDVTGHQSFVALNAGTVSDDVFGFASLIDQGAGNTISDDAYVYYGWGDFDGTVTGTSYIYFGYGDSNVDYLLYLDGTGDAYIANDTQVAGRMAIGSAASVVTERTLNVAEQRTTNTGVFYGTLSYVDAAPTGAIHQDIEAVEGFVNLTIAQTQQAGHYMIGVTGRAEVADTVAATVLTMMGGNFYAKVYDATVTDAIGARVWTPFVDAGTVTDGIGLWVQAGTVGAGSITNKYGVYIDDITGGSTLNYSIYAAGGVAYFGADSLRIKVATTNVDDVEPTDAQLDTAFGTPATVGEGFIGVIDDNNAEARVWFCVAIGSTWWRTRMYLAP